MSYMTMKKEKKSIELSEREEKEAVRRIVVEAVAEKAVIIGKETRIENLHQGADGLIENTVVTRIFLS
ncbi:hypothetical protein GCK72_008880 [Caenorhabditis remanei]|uniref:Uncharacterized protein n=1 Tax=Caenorhabditis remanei TaxID=31234 RepID=A0A6A5H0U4_CAERE|nr:hypothetical protein GCK72_008880 [Caenorhabditis remanei]KAF1760631.1 hypothetical protein GCK72_008880 [Caenorhabditis remanei]